MAYLQPQLVSPPYAGTPAKLGQQVISRPVDNTGKPPPGPPVADWQHPLANGPGSIFQWGQGTAFDISQQPGAVVGQKARSVLDAMSKFVPIIILAVIVLAMVFLLKS